MSTRVPVKPQDNAILIFDATKLRAKELIGQRWILDLSESSLFGCFVRKTVRLSVRGLLVGRMHQDGANLNECLLPVCARQLRISGD